MTLIWFLLICSGAGDGSNCTQPLQLQSEHECRFLEKHVKGMRYGVSTKCVAFRRKVETQ